MDKRLNRKILFDKSSNRAVEPAANHTPNLPSPKPERPSVNIEANKAINVVKWINEHKYFKWSSMCVKIGLDKGNFKRTLESPSPVIPAKYMVEIVAILKQYGYAK